MNLRLQALITFIVYYILLYVGAAIIMYIEADGLKDEKDVTVNATEPLRKLLEHGQNVTLNESKLNEILQLSYKIEAKSMEFEKRSWKKKVSLQTLFKWRYFTHVTITTVGYGDIVPETYGGKVFVIIYSMIGIPVNIFLIAKIGSIISADQAMLVRLVERRLLKVKESKNVEKKTTFILICFSFFWWTGGAGMSKGIMGWSWSDSFYYSYVKLTTIGYGDLLVSFQNKKAYGELISWYTCIGLAIVTGVFNAVSEAMQMDSKVSPKDEGMGEEDSMAMENQVTTVA